MRLARAVFPLVFCVAGWAKAPITHEQMWKMKRVGAPVASPDGKRVVFSVTEPAYDAKDASSDLWVMAADGAGGPRRVTFTKGAESGAAWSPDSKRLAFAAKREGDEEAQIYVLNLAEGGEAERVTNLSTGAGNPEWSPDGRMLVFSSRVYPGAGDDEANKKAAAERKARKYNARAYDTFPVRYWDKWLDDRKPHLFLLDLETRKVRDLLAGTKFAAMPGFDGYSATAGSDLRGVFAPDGRSVLFTAVWNRTSAAYSDVMTYLYQLALDGGEPKEVAGGRYSYSSPQFAPDGKSLYALREVEGDGKTYHLSRLVRAAWPMTGEFVEVSPKFDRSVSSYTFTVGGGAIYLTAEEHGHEKVFSVPAAGGETKLVMPVTEGVYTGVTAGGTEAAPVVLAAYNSSAFPFELARVESGGARVVTSFNRAAAAEIDWQAPRHFWFTSKKGRRVHSMLTLPPGFDGGKKYPLVVMIHGGPHTMARDEFHQRWNVHLMASPGYAILQPNYTGSTGFGEEFAQRILHDPLRTPGEEIEEAVDEALKQFPFLDASRMAAGGASYGGHLANWLQATTARYKCLFSHAGLINLESQWGTSDVIYGRETMNGGPPWEQGPVWREQNPVRYAAKFRTPMLLTVGENDYRVPLNQTLENWSVLQRQQVPSRLVVFADENHWILKGENNRYFYQEWHGWLARWLGGAAGTR